jgi:hypothetical protein
MNNGNEEDNDATTSATTTCFTAPSAQTIRTASNQDNHPKTQGSRNVAAQVKNQESPELVNDDSGHRGASDPVRGRNVENNIHGVPPLLQVTRVKVKHDLQAQYASYHQDRIVADKVALLKWREKLQAVCRVIQAPRKGQARFRERAREIDIIVKDDDVSTVTMTAFRKGDVPRDGWGRKGTILALAVVALSIYLGGIQQRAANGYQEDLTKLVKEIVVASTSSTMTDIYKYDADGDEGIYTGVVLQSTGMPHGVGRMVYEDGRIYEGDWYVFS